MSSVTGQIGTHGESPYKPRSNRYEDRALNFVYSMMAMTIFVPLAGALVLLVIFFRKEKSSTLSNPHYRWAFSSLFVFYGTLALSAVLLVYAPTISFITGVLVYAWFTVRVVRGLMRYIDGQLP
ncbi:hypothetical protein D6779_04485 [Candidatus Parcubacteria bacterium]|nr:MAG: hypothetical protein D6779_04485 [Candidatus Parcubacteria bacterium]